MPNPFATGGLAGSGRTHLTLKLLGVVREAIVLVLPPLEIEARTHQRRESGREIELRFKVCVRGLKAHPIAQELPEPRLVAPTGPIELREVGAECHRYLHHHAIDARGEVRRHKQEVLQRVTRRQRHRPGCSLEP